MHVCKQNDQGQLSKNNYMMSRLGYLTSSNGFYGSAETFDSKS